MELLFGYEIINFFLRLRNPILDRFFIFVTDLGSFDFYLILFSFLFFIYDDKKSFKILFLLFISYLLNSFLKEIFNLPRPDEKIVKPIYKESGGGYGFPSGHSQNSTVTYLALFKIFKKNWLLILSIILITLISLSRIYLGLHFFYDVLGGILIGLIILYIYFYHLDKFFEKFFNSVLKYSSLITISLIFLSFLFLEYSLVFLSLSGIILGMGLNKNSINKTKNFKNGILRILIGYSILIFLIFLFNLLKFNLLYIIPGLWVTYLSRIIFNKLKI